MSSMNPVRLICAMTLVVFPVRPSPADSALEHWSFNPVTRAVPPTPADKQWTRNAVDRFILARLEKEGLKPAPETDRVIWLRRVSFDLIGLPPSPEQVASFVTDPRYDAYERVVNELLQSPRYGERWAQHWMDVVRYADTHGFEVNTERQHAWPYRDYVIRSFNNDTPYDRFIREQIAGDLFGADAATGFLITASVLLPGQIGADDVSKRLARQDALDEIVVNIGQTFLGLSVGCARCHDHKFDPITTRDYYAMQAFVAGVEYGDRELRTPETEAARQHEAAAKMRVAEIDRLLSQFASIAPPVSLAELNAGEAMVAKQLMKEKASLEEEIRVSAEGRLAFAGTFRAPDKIHILTRGDPEQPKDEVAPDVPSALGSTKLAADTPEPERRRALANWIASPENPLTARVMVNRIWQSHFGMGLVETSSDFGRNGAAPSHPELLEWLASEFIRSGWSVKEMHRLIVSSAAYRQSTRNDPEAFARDADDRLLWRYPRRRLEAESIRDAMLAISGTLNLKMYGRGFDLFDKRGGLTGFKPVESFNSDGLRRMIYAHKVRRERDAVFGAFDCPDAGQSTARRRESTTPIQALNLFNSRFTLEQAEMFANRVKTEAGDALAAQIDRACQLALNRDPSAEEFKDAKTAVGAYGLSTLCRVLFNSNEFLFVP